MTKTPIKGYLAPEEEDNLDQSVLDLNKSFHMIDMDMDEVEAISILPIYRALDEMSVDSEELISELNTTKKDTMADMADMVLQFAVLALSIELSNKLRNVDAFIENDINLGHSKEEGLQMSNAVAILLLQEKSLTEFISENKFN